MLGSNAIYQHPAPTAAAPPGTHAATTLVDRMLMVMLALLWLGCLAAYVHQAEHGGIVWPGILVTAAETADGLPVVVGFWPGMGAEASGLLPGDQIVPVETEFLSGVGPVGFFARALEARVDQTVLVQT